MIAAAGTLWALVAAWFLFPLFGIPRLLTRAATALLVAELLALFTWSYGSDQCAERPCSDVSEAARSAAYLDVPALAALVVLLAGLHLRRATRR